MRSTYAVAMGDRREPLDMSTEQRRQHRRLRLEQLGKLLRDVLYRAVVLTQLCPGGYAGHSRGVTIRAERGGQRLGPVVDRNVVQRLAEALAELDRPGGGEVLHRVLAPAVGQEMQRTDRKIVVRGPAGEGVPGVG